MTFELLFYFIMFLLAITFSFVKINNVIYYFFTILFLSTYSIVVRYSGFDVDMNEYVKYLESSNLSFYYLKEPFYWIGSRYLFSLLKSPELVFFLYDMACFIAILLAQEKLKLPKYTIFLVLLFFPSVMGMQNVYRQFISTCFLLAALAYLQVGLNRKSIFLFILSGLSQNVGFLFLPLYFVFNLKKKKVSTKLLLSGSTVLFLLPFILTSKSNSDTGVLGVEVYIFIQLLILLFYVSVCSGVMNSIYAKYIYIQCYLISLVTISAIFMGNAQSKRVGMISLLLSLIPLITIVELKFKNIVTVRVLLIFIITLTTLVFNSSLSMLQTSLNAP